MQFPKTSKLFTYNEKSFWGSMVSFMTLQNYMDKRKFKTIRHLITLYSLFYDCVCVFVQGRPCVCVCVWSGVEGGQAVFSEWNPPFTHREWGGFEVERDRERERLRERQRERSRRDVFSSGITSINLILIQSNIKPSSPMKPQQNLIL